jgi:hypothetical protein
VEQVHEDKEAFVSKTQPEQNLSIGVIDAEKRILLCTDLFVRRSTTCKRARKGKEKEKNWFKKKKKEKKK